MEGEREGEREGGEGGEEGAGEEREGALYIHSTFMRY